MVRPLPIRLLVSERTSWTALGARMNPCQHPVGKLCDVKDLKAMHYEPNPKHKLPWQLGRKGALCPKWSHDQALSLLKQSLPALKGNRRYATINGVAFCAQEHRPGVWHGYPIGWDAVPTKISKQWVKDGKVTRKQIRD